MTSPDDRTLLGIDPDLLAILGFVFAIVLVTQSPVLFGIFTGIVFLGWALVQYGVFDDVSKESEPVGPLEALQTRYARGEIDEAEFERRLDRILASNEAVAHDLGGDRTGATGPDELEKREPERENA